MGISFMKNRASYTLEIFKIVFFIFLSFWLSLHIHHFFYRFHFFNHFRYHFFHCFIIFVSFFSFFFIFFFMFFHFFIFFSFLFIFHHFCFPWCKNSAKNEKLQFSSSFFHLFIMVLSCFFIF